MEQLPQVFVISLKSSTQRRELIRKRLEELKLPCHFIDGIDLRESNINEHPEYDGKRRRMYFGRDLAPGELGCLLSHRKAYQKIVDDAIPHALILEDDAGLESDLPEVIRLMVNSPIEWDMIRFLDKKKVYRKKCRSIGLIDSTHELARLPTNSGGAYGYLMTNRAATRLVELMQHNWLQNDVLHSRTWKTGLTVYIMRPSPVTHPTEDDDSVIGNQRYEKHVELTGWLRVIHPFARFIAKLQDQFMKRLKYLTSYIQDKKNRTILQDYTNTQS